MDDFKLRFAQCGTAKDASSCEFSRVREGLIVALLSIGTLIGALCGAPYVRSPRTDVHLCHNHQTLLRDINADLKIKKTIIKQDRRFLWSSECHVVGMCYLHCRCNNSGHCFHLLGPVRPWSARQRPRRWRPQCCSPYRSYTNFNGTQFGF